MKARASMSGTLHALVGVGIGIECAGIAWILAAGDQERQVLAAIVAALVGWAVAYGLSAAPKSEAPTPDLADAAANTDQRELPRRWSLLPLIGAALGGTWLWLWLS